MATKGRRPDVDDGVHHHEFVDQRFHNRRFIPFGKWPRKNDNGKGAAYSVHIVPKRIPLDQRTNGTSTIFMASRMAIASGRKKRSVRPRGVLD
jgi:hypothetical protein